MKIEKSARLTFSELFKQLVDATKDGRNCHKTIEDAGWTIDQYLEASRARAREAMDIALGWKGAD